jgi:hypothetical protein
MTVSAASDSAWQVRAAARNNAEWCDSICRAHGLPTTFCELAWTSNCRTPLIYPDAVTVDQAASSDDVLPWIDTVSPGCSVKDSFGCLDLRPAGFRVLLEASWICRPVDRQLPTPPPHTRWVSFRRPDALLSWEAAWSNGDEPAGLFRPELLADRAVLVVGGYAGGQLVAGAVLNRSPSVVGVSNLFAVDGDLDGAWSGVLAIAAKHFPGLPAVGYEYDAELDAAVRNGFDPVGALRVWYRP